MLKINDLHFYLKMTEKEEEIEPKLRRNMKTIHTRMKSNLHRQGQKIEKSNKVKSLFFENVNKID